MRTADFHNSFENPMFRSAGQGQGPTNYSNPVFVTSGDWDTGVDQQFTTAKEV